MYYDILLLLCWNWWPIKVCLALFFFLFTSLFRYLPDSITAAAFDLLLVIVYLRWDRTIIYVMLLMRWWWWWVLAIHMGAARSSNRPIDLILWATQNTACLLHSFAHTTECVLPMRAHANNRMDFEPCTQRQTVREANYFATCRVRATAARAFSIVCSISHTQRTIVVRCLCEIERTKNKIIFYHPVTPAAEAACISCRLQS